MSPELLRVSLDPASVLYFRKLAVRKRPITNAIPLPGFTWDADRSRMPGVTDRAIAKQLITAVALAWRAMQGKKNADAVFVSLTKFTVTPETFHFRMDCPHEQVLAPLADKSARDFVAAQSADVNIRHKYAVMDELCPIVFVWQHAAREVLITNEFHIGNPAQFLVIDRVGSTSGLLNFIGAWNLMGVQDRHDELKVMVPALLKDAMAARADEWLRWFHHMVDERVLLEPKRLFVDKEHPETYYYDYSGKPL